jgi:hypothetical protein
MYQAVPDLHNNSMKKITILTILQMSRLRFSEAQSRPGNLAVTSMHVCLTLKPIFSLL